MRSRQNDEARLIEAERQGRIWLAILALCCALFGTACMTSSIVTSVTRTSDGQSLVGQSMSIEFDKVVWDALDPEDREGMDDLVNDFKKAGWNATISDGGRIINGTKDPVEVHQLTKQGWSVNEQKLDTGSGAGSIITATLSSLSIGGPLSGDTSDELIRNIVLIIDQSDPQAARYTYRAVARVEVPEDTDTGSSQPPQPPQPPSGSGDDEAQSLEEWFAMIEEQIENDPKIKKLEQALKEAGPPKFKLGVSLPGSIQSATINGNPGGEVSGNHAQWTFPLVVSGTYNLEATALEGPQQQLSIMVVNMEGLQDGALLYGDTAKVTARVLARDAKTGNDVKLAGPVMVRLTYDGNVVNQGQTDENGNVSLTFSAPESTPDGRSQHKYSVEVVKKGSETLPDTRDIEVVRGLGKIVVALKGVSGTHQIGDVVTIIGSVRKAAEPGMVGSPVEAVIIADDDAGGGIQGATDAEGNFSITLKVPELDRSTLGNKMVVDVVARPKDKDKLAAGESALTILTSSKGSLVVTVSADKAAYGPTENVTLSGMVTADGKPAQVSVDVVVDNIALGSVQSGADGRFQLSVPPSTFSNPGQVVPPYSVHVASVLAHSPGYVTSSRVVAYFGVNGASLDCQAESMVVTNIEGNPLANVSEAEANLNLDAIGPPSFLQVGAGVTQGMKVDTWGGSRVAFSIPLDNNTYTEARMALGKDSTVEIIQYCRDPSGKLHVVLRVMKPGQVLLSWPSGANADLKIITPSGEVSNVHTRFSVAVDDAETTTVATLEGTARLTDDQGTSVDVEASKYVTIAAGQSVGGAIPLEAQGQVDPQLIAMLNGADGTIAGLQPSNPTDIASESSNLTIYMPWLIAGGVGVLLLAVSLGFAAARSRGRKQAIVESSPAIPTQPQDPFALVEAQYQWIRGEVAAGRISPQQRDAMLSGMTVRDLYGRTWVLNGSDGQWLIYDGRQWVRANPR